MLNLTLLSLIISGNFHQFASCSLKYKNLVLEFLGLRKHHNTFWVTVKSPPIIYEGLGTNGLRDHSFSTYAKFSEKLTFLTSWYANVRFSENCAYVLTLSWQRSLSYPYPYHTHPLTRWANQWTGFYMTGTSVVKEKNGWSSSSTRN